MRGRPGLNMLGLLISLYSKKLRVYRRDRYRFYYGRKTKNERKIYMKVDVIKLAVGTIIGGVIYKIGKRKGYNEHVDKVRDVALEHFVNQHKTKES